MKRPALAYALMALLSLAIPCRSADVTEAKRKAFVEMKATAEKGDATAQFNLGVMYSKGQGVEKDYAEATKWWRKAADQGDASAQFNLGLMYGGLGGVEKDYAEAYAWLNLAARTKANAQKFRDDLEKKMSPQQIAEAQKRTKELRAQIEARVKAK